MAQYTAVFDQSGAVWLGYVYELPGASAQGATLAEVRENLEKSVRHVIGNHREYVRKQTQSRSVVVELLDIET